MRDHDSIFGESASSHWRNFAIYPSLRRKVAVITGGGSGIGAVLVEHLARQGARAAFFDIAVDPSRESVRALAGRVDSTPLFIECDVTDTGALRAALQRTAKELGTIGILVNNAASDDRHETQAIYA